MYQYKADILRIIDGDTVEARIDQGLHTHRVEKLRLSSIDAPEKYQQGGAEATDWLKFNIGKQENGDYNHVYIETEKQDKFGRWLAWIFKTQNEMKIGEYGDSLNIRMVREGYAKVYHGGKRSKK